MPHINNIKKEIFLAVDCEFTKNGKVRELTLLLFKNNRLLRVLEIYISKSGVEKAIYDVNKANYHIKNYANIKTLVNSFLTSCRSICPLEKIRLVGIGVSQDIKLVHKTAGKNTLLNSITSTTDLELCGRGRLQDKVEDHKITDHQITQVIAEIVGTKHATKYTYHTSMYDAVAAAYVYCRLVDVHNLIVVSTECKSLSYTYFNEYFCDLQKAKQPQKPLQRISDTPRIPKNFPEVRYKPQKTISNVFDIVPRHLFFEEYSKYTREPSVAEINAVKHQIIKKCYLIKQQLKEFDHEAMRTDPYNIPLVEAGVWLAKEKISIETFIDFAIYIQQYNLPDTKGTYYRVGSRKKEIYLRCLNPLTAKKMFNKKPYCTIDQFIKKPIPVCRLEIVSSSVHTV